MNAELHADGVIYDVDLDTLSQRGGTLAEAVEAEIASQDAAARANLSRSDVPEGMEDFCIPPPKEKLPESKPVDHTRLSSPYVACALCPKIVEGQWLPRGWAWLPDARVCCEECNQGPQAAAIRARVKGRRRRT